ncbi:MAG: NifB/NifX family molybdenum-iron cluster-binding protein [Acidobacteria bacterium]|nr:NifB/NifX family molybdenum-iron cluster-binding protein [Acidobacteriota bacterium]
MKVAIATENEFVSAHFGRCSTYSLFDITDGTITSRLEIENPGHQPGFLPCFLAEKGVDVVIAGGMGPRAQDLFTQNGIKHIRGVQGKVEDVIQAFLKNELQSGDDLCSHPHDHGECQHETELKDVVIQGLFVCITADGDTPENAVDPRFGRAAYFQFYDARTQSLEAVANPFKDLNQGAGIQAAQFIADRKVQALITGECGPKATSVLNASGVKIVTGAAGTVESWIRKLKMEKADA